MGEGVAAVCDNGLTGLWRFIHGAYMGVDSVHLHLHERKSHHHFL